MLTLRILAVAILSVKSQAQDEPGEIIKTQASIVFTLLDEDNRRPRISFAPADPNKQDVGLNNMLNYTSLLESTSTGEYWGLVTSYEDKKIWFNDASRAQLVEYNVDEKEGRPVASDITSGLLNLDYDRVTKILYWTNYLHKTIVAMDTSNYRHFFELWRSEILRPSAIALHVTKRKLFFGAHSNFDSQINKCDLDGSNCQTILQFPDVTLPHGLVIDYSIDKLFWLDVGSSGKAVVLAADLDGKGLRTFFKAETFPIGGLARYQNYIYFTNTTSATAKEYEIHIENISDRRGGSIVKTNFQPRSIDVYAENEVSKIRVPNECNPANCEHLCLASADGRFTCKCSPGYILTEGRKCVTYPLKDDYLLIADIGQKRVFQMPLETSSLLVSSITALPWDDQTDHRILAVAVDMKNGEFVWADQQNKKIVWGDKTIDYTTVSSIVVHCCKEQIYWASNTVIATWDGNSPEYDEIYDLPFFTNAAIAKMTLDCVEDRLYWIENELELRTAKVLRSDLQGNEVETVLSNIPFSQGITIDYETYTLYIATAFDNVLYGLPLKLLKENVPSTDISYPQYLSTDLREDLDSDDVFIWDIRVKNGWVYLADSEASFIRRYSIRDGPTSMERYGPKVFYHASALDFYDKQHYDKFIRSVCPGASTVPAIKPISTENPSIAPVALLSLPGEFGASQDCSAILLWDIDDIKLVLNVYLACILTKYVAP